MRLLVSWVRDFVAIDVSPDVLAETLALCGFEVASIDAVPAIDPPPWDAAPRGPDAVIDFEVTANRPDCLSVIGFAREIRTAFGVPLRHLSAAPTGVRRPSTTATLRVELDDVEACPRYAAAVAEVAPTHTPPWMAARLLAAGIRPINPIVETPVDTSADLPGEAPWPTQPIPHTAAGQPMEPMAGATIRAVDPQFAALPKVPLYTPPRRSGAVHAPREGVHYGASSFNPRTRLLYVAGKELPIYMTVEAVGTKGVPGKMELGGMRVSAAPETGYLVALDPANGETRWRTPLAGGPSTGTLTTSGNVVLVADRQGTLYAIDAAVGKTLWQFQTGGAIRAGQITYAVNGIQYITVPSGGDVILTFALPARRR
mgnify:CR=1 FL=1